MSDEKALSVLAWLVILLPIICWWWGYARGYFDGKRMGKLNRIIEECARRAPEQPKAADAGEP